MKPNTYSATQNNGRITKKKEARVNATEELTFSYDALNRLASAVTTAQPPGETWGPQWSQSFQFDGFGNLTGQVATGAAPNTSWAVSDSTNRLSGSGIVYDTNGNLTQNGSLYMSYDVENRLASVNAGSELYGYAPSNKRVWKRKPGPGFVEEYYFHSISGQRLGTYTKSGSAWTASSTNVYFGGRLVVSNGESVTADRLGSVRQSNRYGYAPVWSRYYPYGVEQTATLEDRDKFGTYRRDGTTGLDYADQRYYGSTVGRFLTSDPYQASGGPSDPGSWNRYGYVEGDPTNANDPSGLATSTTAISGLCVVGAGEGKEIVPCIFLSLYYHDRDESLRAQWDNLSQECQKGLKAKYGNASIKSMLANLYRGMDMMDTFEKAGKANGIDPALLFAIALKESNFVNKPEVDGAGVGVGIFQITVSAASGVTTANASNNEWAADWAAKYLKNNMAQLAAKFPKFTGDELLQATAASYNLGFGGISGNPATIDVGSAGTPKNSYGANVLQLMECFR